jgi:hypothetical protein
MLSASLSLEWAIAEARRWGCALVQLTTDKVHPDAHRFYERLGCVASHEGLKLQLQRAAIPCRRACGSAPARRRGRHR